MVAMRFASLRVSHLSESLASIFQNRVASIRVGSRVGFRAGSRVGSRLIS